MKLTSLLHDPAIAQLSKLKRIKIALLLLALTVLSDDEYILSLSKGIGRWSRMSPKGRRSALMRAIEKMKGIR